MEKNGAAFSINDSIAPQLADIISTPYSKEVSEALMLDRLSEEDIQRTIDSLNLKTELDTMKPEDIDSIL